MCEGNTRACINIQCVYIVQERDGGRERNMYKKKGQEGRKDRELHHTSKKDHKGKFQTEHGFFHKNKHISCHVYILIILYLVINQDFLWTVM